MQATGINKNLLLIILGVWASWLCWQYMGFTDYFAGRNSFLFIKGYFLVILVVFPTGLAFTVLFFDRMEALLTIVCSISFGLILSAGIWAVLILGGVPFHSILFVLINGFLALFLLYLKRENLFTYFETDRSSAILPLIFVFLLLLLGFFLPANLFVNFYTPPDVDAQQQGSIAFFIKHYPSYPVVSPLGNQDKIIIPYPPAYSVSVAIFSSLMNISITDAIMILMVCSVSLFCLLMFATVSFITNNYLLGYIAGVFALNRNLFDLFHDSQATELMGILCITSFLLALGNSFKVRDLKSAILPGLFLGFSALIHTKYFLWVEMSLILFLFTLPLSSDYNKKADYHKIILILLIAGSIFSLWFFDTNKMDIITQDTTKLTKQLQYYILDGLFHWQSNLLVYLSFAGCFVLSLKRRKIEIFLLTMFVSFLILTQHWSLLKLFSPEWFKFNILEPSIWNSFWGTNLRFTSPWSFLELWGLMWYGFNYLLPILCVYAVFPLVEWLSSEETNQRFSVQNVGPFFNIKSQHECLKERVKTGTLLVFFILMVGITFYFKEYVVLFLIFYFLPAVYSPITYLLKNTANKFKPAIISCPNYLRVPYPLKLINPLIIVLPLIICSLLLFVRNEQNYFKKNLPNLFKAEYLAMEWIKNNTDFDSSLVYVQERIRDDTWWGSFWITSVSERKSFSNRINNAKKVNSVDVMPVDSKELEIMYYNIDHPSAERTLRKYKITHILVPSLPLYRTKDEKTEEIHSIYEKSSYVRQVFKSENEPITAMVYEVIP